MLSKGQKVIMFILGMVGLLVGVVVAIPFRAVPGLNQIEGIFKTEVILKIVLSVLALALIIYPLVKKYKLLHDYHENSKVVLVMSYFPIVVYIISTIVNIVQTLSYDFIAEGFKGIISEKMFGILVAALMVYLIFSVFALFRTYEIMMRFSVKENIILDVINFVFLVCFVLLGWRINSAYSFVYQNVDSFTLGNPLIFFTYIFIIIALYLMVRWVSRLVKKDEELIHYVGDAKDLLQIKEKEYYHAYNDILDDFELYFDENYEDYEKLDIQEISDEDEEESEEILETVTLVEEPEEDLEEIIVNPQNIALDDIEIEESEEVKALHAERDLVLKQIEEAKAAHDEIERLQRELEEAQSKLREQRAEYEVAYKELHNMKLENAEAEQQEAEELAEELAKKAKKIVPSFEKMVEYANTFSNREGFKSVSNPKGNLIKFYIGKKMCLVMQSTSNDYRISFITDSKKYVEYLKSRPGELSTPKNLKDNYWVKLVNKGKEDPKFMRKVIKEAFLTAEKQIADEKAAKLAEKKARAAEKAKQRAAEKKAAQNK